MLPRIHGSGMTPGADCGKPLVLHRPGGHTGG